MLDTVYWHTGSHSNTTKKRSRRGSKPARDKESKCERGKVEYEIEHQPLFFTKRCRGVKMYVA